MGAGQLVGRQAPIALDPNNPDAYKVKVPSVSSGMKERVASDINAILIAIGIVALIGGGIGIANVTLRSVTERRAEIGLHRTLGARTRQIGYQFMLESLATGVLGGLIGVALGNPLETQGRSMLEFACAVSGSMFAMRRHVRFRLLSEP